MIRRKIGQIVTGTVAVTDIETVRAHENVMSLKSATKIYPSLRYSVPEIQGTQAQFQGKLPANSTLDGTDMAAPHVTGQIALMMQAAGTALTSFEYRKILMSGVRMMRQDGDGWEPRYGFGRIDCLTTLLRQLTLEELTAMARSHANGSPIATNGTTAQQGTSADSFIDMLAAAAQRLNARIRVQMEIEPASLSVDT